MDKIINWNNLLLTWNDSYIKAEEYIEPSDTYPTSGLIGRWFIDPSINDTYSSNDLSITQGTPGYAVGKIADSSSYLSDGVCHLDGNSTVADVFDNTNQFTISWWQKDASVMSSSALIRVGDNPRINFVLGDNNGYHYYNRFVSASGHTLNQGTNKHQYQTNIWHHIVYVHDGVGNKGYINDGEYVMDASIVADTTSFGTAPWFHLGYDGAASTMSGVEMNGLYIYNRALSASEISQLWNSGDGV